MAHDVFISHSSKDKNVADAVVAALEAAGISCWVAPRDIAPGMDWGEAIVRGIAECKLMVLVYSSSSNRSPQVKREVERAVARNKALVPLRIEDVPLSPSMEYFISSPHWLDALTQPMAEHLVRLVEAVRPLLALANRSGASGVRPAATKAAPARPVSARAPAAAAASAPSRVSTAPHPAAGPAPRPQMGDHSSGHRSSLPGVIVVGLVILSAVLAWPAYQWYTRYGLSHSGAPAAPASRATSKPSPVTTTHPAVASVSPASREAAEYYEKGNRYFNGRDMPKDHAKALLWWRRAADEGNAPAMYSIGLLYANGQGVPKDDAKATEWFAKGAAAGDARCEGALAKRYWTGRGIGRDEAKAVQWFHKAADAGDPSAMAALARLYREGRCVLLDDAKAIQWATKAANAGDGSGMFFVGYAYIWGRDNLPKDLEKGHTWLTKSVTACRTAADNGDEISAFFLGMLYHNGAGGLPKDEPEGFRWLLKAADGGEATAMGKVGVMYQHGGVVPKDDDKATEWFKKGADAGDPVSMHRLALLYQSGRNGVSMDKAKSLDLLQKAADAGNPAAISHLINMYQTGNGVEKNLAKAEALSSRRRAAAELGEEP